MRPPKKVLLYCQDEAELSRVSYALWTRIYRVVVAATDADALRQAAAGAFDCVMVMSVVDNEAIERTLAGLQAALPDTPTLLVLKIAANAPSRATLVSYGWDIGTVIEKLRVLCVRKRGPKKRPVEAVDVRAVA